MWTSLNGLGKAAIIVELVAITRSDGLMGNIERSKAQLLEEEEDAPIELGASWQDTWSLAGEILELFQSKPNQFSLWANVIVRDGFSSCFKVT